MDKNTLLVKTEQGRGAIARRDPSLGPRLRSMLILVDGKRTVAELEKLGAGLGVGTELLEQLAAHGWVASLDAPLPGPEPLAFVVTQPFETGSTPAAAALSPEPPSKVAALPFADARRLVIRFVNDALGPLGEATAIRVESCKSVADLLSVLPRVREALKNLRGTAIAERFDREVLPQLPLQ